MNIQRVVEKDTRSAFDKVKELYGDDSVILSNKRIGKHVELMVAVDLDPEGFDPTSLEEKPESSIEKKLGSKVYDRESAKTAKTVEWMRAMKKADEVNSSPKHAPISEQESIDKVRAILEKTQQKEAHKSLNDHSTELADIHEKMDDLHNYFKTHLDISSRNEREALSVQAKDILQKLENKGFSKTQIAYAQKSYLTTGRKRDFWKKTLNWLKDSVTDMSIDPVLDGGVFALVGLTGVGKTTTIAKIASQAALLHGNDEVIIISLDHNRIGSKEQLKLYGMMLDVEVRHAKNNTDLKLQLDSVRNRKVVLIDTSGVSIKNHSLPILCDYLHSADRNINILLALAANTQSEINAAICESVEKDVDGVLVTKIDEVLTFGGVISSMMASELPLAGITNGQEVPQHYARLASSDFVDMCFDELPENCVLEPAGNQASAA